MVNVIVLFVFVGLLLIALFGAIGMWIAGEKGQSTTKGFLLGALLPIIGLIILGATPSSDTELVDEMYKRELLTKEEYDKTMEIVVKK